MSDPHIEYYYEVVEAEDLLTLRNLVAPLLHDGYELAGGVSAYAYRDSSGDLRIFYCQAVIKINPTEAELNLIVWLRQIAGSGIGL